MTKPQLINSHDLRATLEHAPKAGRTRASGLDSLRTVLGNVASEYDT